MTQRPRLLLAAILLAVVGLLAPAPAAPRAAAAEATSSAPPAAPSPPRLGLAAAEAIAPELQIVTDARYLVQPSRSRVHLTLDATISNTHRDKPPARMYYDTAYLAVLPDTEHFAVTSPGAKPTVSIRSATRSYTLLTINLGRRLYAGKHTPLQLTFDLPDRGGAALRDVRVSASLVAFPVWAFATAATPGSSAAVVFPSGYNVQLQVGKMRSPTSGVSGTPEYSTGVLDKPLDFYAYFVADRPGAFAETPLVATVGGIRVPLVVRAWADDRAWGTRVGSLVRRGLPALSSAIGLPYRGEGLVVQEAVSRTIGGYAGLYDPVAATIQVAYYAGPFVILHETAHAWFNGRLVSDRWISEAFASWYAQRAAAALKVEVEPPTLTPELLAAAIPLNAWAGVGRADEIVEDYAYAATFRLAGLIAAKARPAGLAVVWRAAADGEYAYQPFGATGAPETGAPPPDWRGLLDLLEERTTGDYTELWRAWVLRQSDRPLLDERASAREAYSVAVVAAGDWELPSSVRRAMSAWQFGQAQALLTQVREVLGERARLATEAAEAGLTLPSRLRMAFEGADGPAAATAEAERELDTVQAIVTAERAGHQVGGMLEQIGLLGLRPEADIVEARAAFAQGNLASALSHAATAQAIWQASASRGQQRLISGGIVLVGLVLLVVVIAALWRTRRARRRETAYE